MMALPQVKKQIPRLSNLQLSKLYFMKLKDACSLE